MNDAAPGTLPDGNREQSVRNEPTNLISDLTNALHDSEATLRAIGDLLPIGVFVHDANGRLKYANPAVLDILHQSGQLAPECWQETIHPDDAERVRGELAASIQSGQTYRTRTRFMKRGGETVVAEIVAAPLFDRDGQVSGAVGAIQGALPSSGSSDEAELALRISERQYRQIVDTTQEGVWLRDAEARTVFVNRRLCEMLGYTADEMMGRPVTDFMDADARAEAERRFLQRKKGERQQHDVRYLHKDGSDVWAIVSASPMYDDDGVFIGGLGMITDITERKRHEELIRWQAYHDPLTDLPNRKLFEDRLHQLLVMAERHLHPVAVMFIDLDGFKQVNDTLGHDYGDHLLKVVAERISGCLRGEDTVARMGGDEFAVLLPGIEHPDAIAIVAQKLLEALAQPIDLAGQEVSVSGSIGVSLHPNDGDDVQSLLKHADVAMYRAKEQGGNRYCLFTQSMSANAREHFTMESSLRKALCRNELHLVYQPQVEIGTGEIVGVEALCRWTHPDLGPIPPCQFIPLAEETGMIAPIGEWVLREACLQAAQWRDAGHPIRVSVNISSRQFAQPGLTDVIRSVLAETSLDARWLELELTESAIMKSPQSAVDVLLSLRDLGVHLALDDFGTGYSSLSYLRQFPFDVLKIDRSFITSIVDDKINQALVQAIIDLSNALKLKVVAEGVETADQRQTLQTLGCHIIQGYLFSSPVLPDQIPALRRCQRAA
ncbi:MAG: EAL domain-containing protein [Capsulimonas sp.]|uniref:putative bifunctional diguanylate cyclase/phosphodiesterase n=1 Tax=Capsulimonas sp. TaxID=2494211 RepID=UPI00326320EF